MHLKQYLQSLSHLVSTAFAVVVVVDVVGVVLLEEDIVEVIPMYGYLRAWRVGAILVSMMELLVHYHAKV